MVRSFLVALVLAACLPLAACGGDDGGGGATAAMDAETRTSGPPAETTAAADLSGVPLAPDEPGLPVLGIVVTREEGGRGRFDVSVSGARTPGVVRIENSNVTSRAGDMQLFRVDGDHAEDELVAALDEAVRGGGLPAWLHPAGGPGRSAPDGSAVVTTRLRPGTHWAVDMAAGIGGRPAFASRRALAPFSVEGEDEQWLWPEPAPRITVLDDGFRSDPLPAGRAWFELVNDGVEPHQVVFVALGSGRTLEDVRRAIASPRGRAEVDRSAAAATAVLAGGDRQLVRVQLRRGRYALLCLASDRRGGPPHATEGMVGEVTVG